MPNKDAVRNNTPRSRERNTAWWNDLRIRAVLYQVLVVVALLLIVAYLVNNTLNNLSARNIATGLDFLGREAGFGIGESLIEYHPANTYLRALWVGILNTLKVSLIGIALATVLGTLAGIARLSSNWLVARVAALYVEVLRNIPLLLQLFFWYSLITVALPGPPQALNPLPGMFLTNRGMYLPYPVWERTHILMIVAMGVGLVCTWFVSRWARHRQQRTGQALPIVSIGAALIIGLPILVFLAGGMPSALDVPTLQGFNFVGGSSVSPEFTALLAGLVFYTGTFIAEIVRGGILAVPGGQTEAGLALGLKRSLVLRLIVLPQALRVIVPPLTSQYLNLIKNSSLAVAIGYPDLVSIANTTINQTGQAVEGIAVIMTVYLTVSLSISILMNWYNRRIALKGGR
ncbi:MAG: amino acid ABC transporter permease [Pseudomonadota bacterium]